ncbi:hypothetical protein Tco_0518646, partial [Tanacetum coccineum]
HLRIEESLRAQESDKGKGKEVDGPSVNMTEEGKNKNNKHNKRKKHGTGEYNGSSGYKKSANAGGSKKGSKDQSQNQGQSLVNV